MGNGDRRRSLKMKRRVARRKFKARVKRRKQQADEQRSR